MINRNQNKPYLYGNNQARKIQYPKNQMNPNQKPATNFIKKNITPNTNFDNRNIQNNINQQRNQYLNNNFINPNDELGKAILIIKKECKKKDDRIKELERKVIDLTTKLNILLKNNKNIELNEEFNNPGDINPFSNNQLEKMDSNKLLDGGLFNKINKDIRGHSIGYTGINKNNQRINNYMQNIGHNNINYNSDNEKAINNKFPGYDNLSHSNDHSVLTYNGGGSQTSSKAEVKNYLKEVKSKIEPKKFKEFIRNIKLLTAKNNTSLNKNIIVESVRILFGEEHKDLFIKFENIIGVKK